MNNYVHSIYKYVKQENKELIEVKSTDAAAQSLAIFANFLNFLSVTRSTNDSMDVLSISRTKTEVTVAINIRNSTWLIFNKYANKKTKKVNNKWILKFKEARKQ